MHKSDSWLLFDAIAPTYDKINRVLSLGIDAHWRKKIGLYLPRQKNMQLLDCATGTGDQIFALMRQSPNIKRAVGIDLSENMLKLGREKLKKSPYEKKVVLRHASALKIPYPAESFECATMSFGIRNVSDTVACLKEIHRVLKKKGTLLLLEFSLPKNKVMKKAHLFYLRKVLPRLGGMLSKNRPAYTYLNQTIEAYPYGDAFCSLLKEAGFQNIECHPWSLGIVSLYSARK